MNKLLHSFIKGAYGHEGLWNFFQVINSELSYTSGKGKWCI